MKLNLVHIVNHFDDYCSDIMQDCVKYQIKRAIITAEKMQEKGKKILPIFTFVINFDTDFDYEFWHECLETSVQELGRPTRQKVFVNQIEMSEPAEIWETDKVISASIENIEMMGRIGKDCAPFQFCTVFIGFKQKDMKKDSEFLETRRGFSIIYSPRQTARNNPRGL